MPFQSNNLKIQQGFSTLEMLLAIAVFMLFITAVFVVSFGNQSLALDSETNTEAQHKAQKYIEKAVATAREDYAAVVADLTPITEDIIYQKQLIIDPDAAGECGKEIQAKVTWTGDHNRNEYVTVTSSVANIPLAIARGGDCAFSPPEGPGLVESSSVNVGGNKATGLDVLNKFVYLAFEDNPGFIIINATDPTNAYEVPVTNGFSLSEGVNFIDVATQPGTSKKYAYIAYDNETVPFNQFLVVDVTISDQPVLRASRSLPGVTGSCPFTCPQGRSIFYFDEKVYVGTHRLVGATKHEFHVYCVGPDPNFPPCSTSSPINPIWLGSEKIDHNINEIQVVKQDVGGSEKTIAYLASSSDSEELIVLDVTDPTAISQISSRDLSGIADGESLNVDANRNVVYVGKLSAGGAELFVVDISDLTIPLSLVGTPANVGSSVLSMRAVGAFLYVGTDENTNEFQVWDSDPNNLISINAMNISNKEAVGIDYEDGLVYAAFKQGSKSLVVFRAP